VKELCLAIGLVVVVAGGLERVGGLAAHLAAGLTQTEDIDNLLDLEPDFDDGSGS